MKKVLVLACALALAACDSKSVEEPQGADSKLSVHHASSANVRLVCYDGVLYFSVWNNNTFVPPYISGAVIDKETLQPKRCK